MPDTTHHDLVTIEIRGEKAQITLEELRSLFVSLQTAATQTGETVDAAMTALAMPIERIAQNTGIAVQELQALRTQLAGMAGVAGVPETAATGLRDMASAAREAQAAMGGAIVPGYGAPGAQMISGMTAQDVAGVEDYKASLERVAPAADAVAEASDKGAGATRRWNASFQRHIIWFAQGTVIYYALNSIIQTITGTIEGAVEGLLAYDTAMGQMRYITGETTTELGKLADEARGIGVTLGQLPTDVLPGLVEITQATKDYNEQLTYSRDAARWAFMSGQEYDEGLENLIAVQRVWNMEADEGQRVLDVVATSYRSAMIPMDEMMDTLERGGKIAESVGLSFEEYAATIAAVGEYSDLTASQVTTLMERISARPFQADLARRFQKEFGFLNIELFEPGTAQTQRREIADILDELSGYWDQLTASQRQSVAEIMASSRQASEFLTLMEAWQKVPDYVDEYNDSLGESNRLIEEQMGTLENLRNVAVAAFRDMTTSIAQSVVELLGLKDMLWDLGITLEAQAAIARKARGGGAEPPTVQERGQQNIATWQAELDKLYAVQEQVGYRRAETAIENRIAQLEALIAATEGRLELLTPSETKPDADVMGEYRSAQKEAADFAKDQHQKILSEEQAFQQRMAEVMRGEYATGVDAWVAGLENVSSVLDLTELSQEQINQAQQDSRDMALEIYEAYVAQAEELAGTTLTWQQQQEIWNAMVEAWAETVTLIRNAKGELEIVTGLEAAFLDDTTEALQAEKERFNIQRLGRVQPQQFEQLQQGAWQWQAYLGTLPGYDEEARQFYVVLADGVARPIVTTSTALRYAIEDLTEVEKRQLEGMWNLPAGVTAYVPITSLFYQQQQATGAPGGTSMAGPPWTGSRIDTTPVDMAVGDLSANLFTAADSTMNFAEAAAAAMLMLQEGLARASILTPERRAATELALDEYTARTSILTPERRTDVEQALQENPWGNTPINISLTSQLYLNQTLLATALQQTLGANLSNSARGYGTNAGGNAPPIMI